MSYSEDDGSPLKKIAGGVAIVIVALIAGAIARGGTREIIDYSRSSPSSVEDQFEEVFNRDPQLAEFFGIVESEFPSDYQNFLNEISRRAKAGENSTELYQASFMFMQNFMKSHTENIASAPQAEIQEIIKRNLAAAESLASISPSLCAHFTMDGLRPTDQIPAGANSSIFAASTAMLRAAAAGRDSPVIFQETTEDDWMNLVDEIYDRGATDSEIEALFNGTYSSLPDDAQCRLGTSFMGALANLENEISTRIMRELLAENQS